MNPAHPNSSLSAETLIARDLLRVAVPVLLVTVIADFLFWDALPGINIGIFGAAVGAILFAVHREKPAQSSWVLAAMLAATCIQSGLSVSLSNVIAAAGLLLALAGNAFQPHLPGMWARLSESFHGIVSSVGHWLRIRGLVSETARAVVSSSSVGTGHLVFAAKVILPAMVLVVVFGIILAAGNAAFGEMLARGTSAAFRFWDCFDISFFRVFWWALLATVALGIFHGLRAPDAPRWWTKTIPVLFRSDAKLARWQTAFALVAMNALFFLVNTLDAIFLWGHADLPSGVTPAEFVHAGVYKLILAVILSALVIAGIFQQQEAVVRNRWIRGLGFLWVFQNCIMISGVFRRLMLYAEEYMLTEKRVYVGCFLLLVTVGFGFLAWFVHERRSLNWLIGRSAAAAFLLFFVLQFLHIERWVAQYNVGRWQAGGALDLDYLAHMGPNAWPELVRVARGTGATSAEAARIVQQLHANGRSGDWRAFQWNKVAARNELAAFVEAR